MAEKNGRVIRPRKIKIVGKNTGPSFSAAHKMPEKQIKTKQIVSILEGVKSIKQSMAAKTLKSIIVLDTNVLINNHKVIKELSKDGHLVVIPETCIKELDKKKLSGNVISQARRALREIDRIQTAGSPLLIVEKGMLFGRLNLDKNNPDHQIIATLNYVAYHASQEKSVYHGYNSVKMLSGDFTVKIISRGLKQGIDILVDSYSVNSAKTEKKENEIPHFFVNRQKITTFDNKQFFPAEKALKKIPEGGAIIGYSSRYFKDLGEFAAIRRGDSFFILDENISAYGVSCLKLGRNRPNWGQIIAMHQLLNPINKCVFLTGVSGGGKSHLTFAVALELVKRGFYKKIVVYRVPESAYGESSPALPGDVGQKIAPWIEPIIDILKKIENLNQSKSDPEVLDPIESIYKKKKKNNSEVKSKNKGKGGKGKLQEVEERDSHVSSKGSNLKVHVDDIFERFNVEIKILDYIRGITLEDSIVILDDAQNVAKNIIKNLLTRGGLNTLFIINGDVNQIDNRHIDKDSCGLTQAITRMQHLPFVSVVNILRTVRGPVAAAAEEYL